MCSGWRPLLRKNGNRCPVLLASSIQASLTGRYAGSAYGQSKKAAEELPQEAPKKEREQAKGAEIDIERLMREMTKRLWEEREASGRRLRR